jgi:hypothetical protein
VLIAEKSYPPLVEHPSRSHNGSERKFVNPALALFVLAVLPPALLAVAHAYAMAVQDKKVWCVVVMDDRVRSLERVLIEHRQRYHVTVVQEWDALTKGYRARIPVKYLAEIETDRRVQTIQSWEKDEFLDPNTAFARLSH